MMDLESLKPGMIWGIPIDNTRLPARQEPPEFPHQAAKSSSAVDRAAKRPCHPAPKTAPKTASIVSYPSENDVLVGRGRSYQDYPGNVAFRKLIEANCEEYDTIGRHDRMILTRRLIHQLAADKVRFLKQLDDGYWLALDVSEVQNKVSQQFRSIRKKKRRNV